MSDSDSTSHRLRLVYLSAAIVLYFIAGGHFANGTVNFPFVNIRLDRVWVIEIFVWLLFFWYWWRFFVSIDNCFWKHFTEEFTVYAKTRMHREIDDKATTQSASPVEITYHVENKFTPMDNFWSMKVSWKEVDSSRAGYSTVKFPIYSLVTLKFLRTQVSKPKFDLYLFPMISAFAACIAGAVSLILKLLS